MNSLSPETRTASRIAWVDVAKGIGIGLVFYGHFVQRFIDCGVPAALYQMKWVYSFHMPLFFFLVGIVYKDWDISFEPFLKRQLRTRLVPAWAFNVVGMLIWVAVEYARGDSGWVREYGWSAVARHCASETFAVFVQGRPSWNILTWFLTCLFTIEVWQFCLRSVVRRTGPLVISILCFGMLATAVDWYSEPIHTVIGPRRHWWLITSGLTAMVFYQLGILVRRLGLLTGERSTLHKCILSAMFLAVTLLTFNLNRGLDNYPSPIVLMIDAKYGDMWWFFASSLAGTCLIVYISRMLSASRVLKYVGQITLALMCLDGILHDFVNAGVAKWVVGLFPEPNALSLTLICVLGTVLSILVCIPVTWFIQRYLPFIVGRGISRPALAGGSRSHPRNPV